MTTDEQLVAAALAGSGASFDELVERYQQRLFRFLLVRSASRADAEDALQETFFNAFRYLRSYNPRWRFSTWLYRIALRIALRKAARPERRETVACEELADPAADPLLACIADSERENVWLAAKRCLPADAQSALWLRYAEDLSIREIARVLGRPEVWTRVTLLRARRQLRKTLADGATIGHESKAYG